MIRKRRRIRLGVMDGDLVEARSFSLATKQRMQRERSRERLARRDEEWRRSWEDIPLADNVTKLFGEGD